MPTVLFVHTNFPAQFGDFGAWAAHLGWDVWFATTRQDLVAPPRCRMFTFQTADASNDADALTRPMDKALRQGWAFAQAAEDARAQGLVPDLVVAHSGWGVGTFVKAVWPDTKLVAYMEWWYNHPACDVAPEEPPHGSELEQGARAIAQNAPSAADAALAEAIIVPTSFQASQFPAPIRPRIHVLHDGIDTVSHAPDPDARDAMATHGVPEGAPLVTYATRGMEPYRGFPQFMRALDVLQSARADLHAIIVAEDRVAYGVALPDGDSWKARMLTELDLDESRLHFTGLLPQDQYAKVLQASDAHVYLTIPFVLSWSFIEALSTGCPIVASDTAPVREAADGSGAVLVDHMDTAALAAAIEKLLDDPETARRASLKSRKRALIAYDRKWLWPAKLNLLARIAGR